jgi:hypothetical protein
VKRVRTSINPHEHRPMLGDVPLEPLEILDMIGSSSDNENLVPKDGCTQLGHPNPVKNERPLTPKKLDGVGGESLKLSGQPSLGLDHEVGDGLDGLLGTAPNFLVPEKNAPFMQADLAALLDGTQDLGPNPVNEHDPGTDNDLGPKVGKPPRDRGRSIDHTSDLGLDESVGGSPIEIDLVKNDDVPRPDPPKKIPSSSINPRDTGGPRPGLVRSSKETGELHESDSDKRTGVKREATPTISPTRVNSPTGTIT